MSQTVETRAVFGVGANVAAEYERAVNTVGAFLDRVDQAWGEHDLPRGMDVRLRAEHRLVHGEDSTFFIRKDFTDEVNNPVVIWRSSRDPKRAYYLEFNPMVIMRNTEGISAYEITNATDMYRDSIYTAYMYEDGLTFSILRDVYLESFMIMDEINDPLSFKDANLEKLDIQTVAQFVSMIDMDKPEVFPVATGYDEEEDDWRSGGVF